MSPKTLLLIVLAMLLPGTAAYLASSRWTSSAGDAARLPLEPACDISASPCTTTLPDGGRLTLEVLPRPIPLMTNLTVAVTVAGSDVSPTRIEIVGTNMDMGVIPARLMPGKEKHWRAETILPVCSQTDMRWEARLWLENADGGWIQPYAFGTQR